MKKILFLTFIVVHLFSCNSGKSDKVATFSDTLTSKIDTVAVEKNLHYFWSADLDQKNGLVMKKVSPLNPDSLNAESIINHLNEIYPEIKVTYLKKSNDSIYVRIGDSKYLTNQMGSSGADAYLAELTYNLTELVNTNYVNVRFREGDHAAPGTYARTDFVH